MGTKPRNNGIMIGGVVIRLKVDPKTSMALYTIAVLGGTSVLQIELPERSWEEGQRIGITLEGMWTDWKADWPEN